MGSWHRDIPKDIKLINGFLSHILEPINTALACARAVAAIKGAGGITAKIADGNIIISADALAARLKELETTTFFRHPFQVSISDQSDPANPKANIQASSRIYPGLGASALSITDLTTEFILASLTCVWIEVTVSAMSATAAARKTGTSFPSLVVISGSPAAQTQFNVPIGRVVSSDLAKPGFEFSITASGTTTNYHFEQCLFSHLLIQTICADGTAALYGFPWGGEVPFS